MKTWFHVDCFFALKKTKNSKLITSSDDVDGWDLLSKEDKDLLIKNIGPDFKETSDASTSKTAATASTSSNNSKDNLFSEFQRIVGKIANEPSYNNKSQILQKYLRDVRKL